MAGRRFELERICCLSDGVFWQKQTAPMTGVTGKLCAIIFTEGDVSGVKYDSGNHLRTKRCRDRRLTQPGAARDCVDLAG